MDAVVSECVVTMVDGAAVASEVGTAEDVVLTGEVETVVVSCVVGTGELLLVLGMDGCGSNVV